MDKRVIFIAFPIDKCTTSKEVEKRFTELSEKVIDTYGSKGPVEIIDYHIPIYSSFGSFMTNVSSSSLVSAKRCLEIMKLSRYIYKMNSATDVYFSKDYEKSSDCLVERKVAEEYGMRILDER